MSEARPSRRRRLLERSWIVASMAYGGLRIAIADRTVKRYGVNIWAFAAVELATAWLYGLATARVVGALVDRDRRRAVRWALVSTATFVAPELFIVATGRRMPAAVYAVIAGLLLTLGTVASVTSVRKVRSGRRAREQAAAEGTAPAVASGADAGMEPGRPA